MPTYDDEMETRREQAGEAPPLALPPGMIAVNRDWLDEFLARAATAERLLEKGAEYARYARQMAADPVEHAEVGRAMDDASSALHLARLWALPACRTCHFCAGHIDRLQDAKLVFLGPDYAPEVKHKVEAQCKPLVIGAANEDDAMGHRRAA